MKTFFERLESRMEEIDSLLCVGLDPHPEDLDHPSGSAAFEFCSAIIQQTHKAAAAYKPNAAFFEALGQEGFKALRDVIRLIPEEIPVILDFKRGDISSTARAYAASAFDSLQADAVTLNPYLGRDAIEPFLDYPEKGAFVLCKTSNAGAADFQDLPIAAQDQPLYQAVAGAVRTWNRGGNLGLVIGATQLEALAAVRSQDEDIWILAPGIGPQGGNLTRALQVGLRADGLGMLIPVSRSIARAENPGRSAQQLRDEINRVRTALRNKSEALPSRKEPSLSSLQREVARGLLELGCLQFGDFQLKSGQHSPVYIDLRRLPASPAFLTRVAAAYRQILLNLPFDHLAALPYAALPITTAVGILGAWPMIYPRKEAKEYGTTAEIEGLFEPGDRAVILDDLITTGESKLEVINRLQSHGLQVEDIVVLIDRSRNAQEALLEMGLRLHAFLALDELLDFYKSEKLVEKEKIEMVERYLRDAPGS